MNVVVYRSRRMPDTYIYIKQSASIEDLPEGLAQKFRNPEPFLEIELHAKRYLQQADPIKVMTAIETQGYYLQLPPAEKDDILAD